MDLGIAGRTALVLGGGGGLGRAIAIALARESVNIAFGDISLDALKASVQALEHTRVQTKSVLWDLADLDSIDSHVAEIESSLGPIDILVNITGGPPPTPAANQDPGLWSKHFQAMILSVIAITDRVVPSMR